MSNFLRIMSIFWPTKTQ